VHRECVFARILYFTLIYNIADILAYNVWSIIRESEGEKHSATHNKVWEIYLFLSDCSIDLLAMINTLSLFLIFYQIYTTREEIATAFGLQLKKLINFAPEDVFGQEHRKKMTGEEMKNLKSKNSVLFVKKFSDMSDMTGS
jgi:hypothetical protein